MERDVVKVASSCVPMVQWGDAVCCYGDLTKARNIIIYWYVLLVFHQWNGPTLVSLILLSSFSIHCHPPPLSCPPSPPPVCLTVCEVEQV